MKSAYEYYRSNAREKGLTPLSLSEWTATLRGVGDPQGKLTFGEALQAMSEGKCVARTGWNGQGMFVERVANAEVKLSGGRKVTLEPFFVLRSPYGEYTTWSASVSDMMARDWEVR